MKKIIALLLSAVFGCSLSLAGVLNTPVDSGSPFIPAEVDTAGGPDAFGYTWKDNLEPGGPRYGWLDVSGAGELVSGLGDDNYVGPFQIGFPFRFYWYDVTQFYIGSNGYLKFGSPASIASPFPATIPLTATPNDFIGVYMADWVLGSLTAPDSCLLWTNNQDTCVVSWVNVEAWQPTGNTGSHTFQVILTDTDSSITFQIGSQSGPVYQSANWELSGIECNNGQVGLQRSANMLMPASYAVKFYYPDVVTYQVHDLAAEAVSNPNSEGFFLEVGDEFTPWAVVKNVGNQPETSYQAQFIIQQIGGAVQYNQTVSGGPIAPGEEQIITYAATWTPALTQQYATRLTVTLAGEMNPANNLKSAECRTLTLPGTLLFDDGSPDAYLQWQGGGGGDAGGATRFVPPSYPIRIDSVKFMAGQPTEDVILGIQDDDGPGGIPGTMLYSDTVDVTTTNTWYARGVSAQNIEITDGAFYVVWLMLTATSGLAEDQTPTQAFSRQAWEYTGVWSPYRAAETSDFMLRARISPVAGPNQPPEIVNYYPTDLDTVELNDAVDFGVTATDPDGDPLSYVWKLDDVVQGTDSTVTIIFDELGAHEVGVWVSDGELSDSMFWDVTVVAVGVEPFERILPTEYALQTPHPNPFNPTTTITFSLPLAGDVRLSVYDQTGREIAKLVAGWRPAGTHDVVFDATGLSSGIYLVKMMTGNFTASQKIVMMK
jgi:hypothetical protein